MDGVDQVAQVAPHRVGVVCGESAHSPKHHPFHLIEGDGVAAAIVELGGFGGGVALSLIFAGALGNLIDRLSVGYITDFIYVRLWDNVYWPAFNIADSAITIGAISLAVIALVKMRKKDESKPESAKKDI